MKRYETRVLVEKSAVGEKYYAQYKSKFLWLIPIWECFDIVWSPELICKAVGMAYKHEKSETATMKEFAELQCEIYHQLYEKLYEKKRNGKFHDKTKKVSYYKHP